MSDHKIVDILSRQPTLEGLIKCLACHHEWTSEETVGSVRIECPECHCHRGVWKFPISLVVGSMVFVCNKCEVDIFQLQPNGAKCMGCGARLPWSDIVPPS